MYYYIIIKKKKGRRIGIFTLKLKFVRFAAIGIHRGGAHHPGRAPYCPWRGTGWVQGSVQEHHCKRRFHVTSDRFEGQAVRRRGSIAISIKHSENQGCSEIQVEWHLAFSQGERSWRLLGRIRWEIVFNETCLKNLIFLPPFSNKSFRFNRNR